MTADPPRILVIEDEPEIRRFLRASLAAHDFDVHEAATGQEGLRQAAAQPPDVVLLDLGLPDISGFEVIEQLRGWSQRADHRAVGPRTGSRQGRRPRRRRRRLSDQALRRRRAAGPPARRPAASGAAATNRTHRPYSPPATSASIWPAARCTVAGEEVHLTPTEYRLLTTLIKHAGKVLTHRQLLKEVWGPDCTHETHYLRVYINQLRHKLGDDAAQPQLILTEPGIGYRFCEPRAT